MIDARTARKFRRSMRRCFPKEWKVRAVFDKRPTPAGTDFYLTGYEITTDDGAQLRFDPSCEVIKAPEGWTVTYQGRWFYGEITIAFPHGIRITFDDNILG
jgi:hypothetical protein